MKNVISMCFTLQQNRLHDGRAVSAVVDVLFSPNQCGFSPAIMTTQVSFCSPKTCS